MDSKVYIRVVKIKNRNKWLHWVVFQRWMWWNDEMRKWGNIYRNSVATRFACCVEWHVCKVIYHVMEWPQALFFLLNFIFNVKIFIVIKGRPGLLELISDGQIDSCLLFQSDLNLIYCALFHLLAFNNLFI